MNNTAHSFFRDRPEWADITPLKQDESPRDVVRIAYSDAFIDAHDYVRAVMAKDERSPRALSLTTECLQMNPANYTVWEYRRRILLSLKTPLVNEHHFVKTFLYEHPKNYQLWYHCQWLMEQMFKEDSPKEVFKKPESEQFQTLSRELDLVKTVLADDAKNYHAWQYRRWLVDFFAIPPSNELEFCGALLREDIFNNSAWNHRFYTVIEEGLDGNIFDRELKFTEDAIRASPNNQSACNYLIGILSPLPRLTPNESGQLTAADDLPSEANLLRVREFIEDTIAQDISGAAESPALLSLLVEVLYDFLRILHKKCGGKPATAAGVGDAEKAEDIVRQLISLCDRLALELDRVRANYWRYRYRQVEQMAAELNLPCDKH